VVAAFRIQELERCRCRWFYVQSSHPLHELDSFIDFNRYQQIFITLVTSFALHHRQYSFQPSHATNSSSSSTSLDSNGFNFENARLLGSANP
jgi:hypothetical protein